MRYFQPLSVKSTLLPYLSTLIESVNPYYYSKSGLYIIEPDLDQILKDTTLRTIYEQYSFSPLIFKFEPFENYNWHKDITRGVSINLEIKAAKRQVMFGVKKNDAVMKITKFLNYSPNTYYIFNNQEYHNIINFEGERFLFTLDFIKNKDKLTYKDVLEYCKLKKLY